MAGSADSGAAAAVLRDGGQRAISPRLRDLLERLVVRHERTAAILRAHGADDAARRADRYAARVRLTMDEPAATERMRALTRSVRGSNSQRALTRVALEGAMTMLEADMGNLQLIDRHGALRIVAQHGFGDDFLEHFAAVDDAGSVCGRALRDRSQTVIADVRVDPAFAPHRAIAAASGFRAVQSTPLVDNDGRVRGIVSTHFPDAREPSERDLQLIEWYGEQVGAILARPVPAS